MTAQARACKVLATERGALRMPRLDRLSEPPPGLAGPRPDGRRRLQDSLRRAPLHG